MRTHESEAAVKDLMIALDHDARLTAAKLITRVGLAFTWVGEKLIRVSAWLMDYELKEIV